MTGRLDVLGLVILVAAVVLGVWLGLHGPDMSPVISQAPAIATTDR